MNHSRKGAEGERLAKKQLEAAGYVVTKSGGSLGAVDLIAIGTLGVRCIQVKVSTDRRQLQKANLEAIRETLYPLPRPQAGGVSYEIWVRYKKTNDRKWYWYRETV